MRLIVLLLLLAASFGSVVAGGSIDGIAFINDDGSLRIGAQTVWLYGIDIPPTDSDCYTFVRPPLCAPRAVLALKFRVNGFVHCKPQTEPRPDGSVEAICRVDEGPLSAGDDLAEYLLQRGWAVALPDAPFRYHTLERIARSRGLGVWGLSVVPGR